MTIEDIIKQAEEKNQEGDYKNAFLLYSKAIEVLPNDPNLFSARGIILFHLDKKEDALSDLDKAVELEPNYSYRYSSRAYIKASLKMTEEAIEDYKRCTELDPEDSIAYNNMGLLQDQLGWNKKAERTFQKADSLDKVLKDRGISTQKSEEATIVEEPESPLSKKRIIKNVFTKKETFKEFVNFIKSGFKLKED